MAILEPAMVETLAQTCMEVVKEGYDKIVALGYLKLLQEILYWGICAYKSLCCLKK
jgi:hypothetical protein